jgi:hypothetical protein
MSNEIFPAMPGLSWNVTRQPEFTTKVQKAISGREIRLAFMSSPMCTFKMSFEVLRQDLRFSELRKLGNFFLERMGRFDSFLYSDPGDDHVDDQHIGDGNGTQTAFQLARSYGPVNTGFTEAVHNPKTDANASNVLALVNVFLVPNILANPLIPYSNPIIYVNGVAQTEGTDYTLGALGAVNFAAPVANGAAVSWTGGYYYRVRFNQDAAEFNNFMQALWELKKCELYGSLADKV